LLVVIAIIGIQIGMLLPAVRENLSTDTRYLVAAAVLASAIGICFFTACSGSSSASLNTSLTKAKNVVNSSNLLDRPIRISVNDAPLNSKAKKMFPSPAVFDVDGDGSKELVIGDLMGGVGVYANLNTSGAGEPVWGPRKPHSLWT